MTELSSTVWIELRKALRSRMPLFTTLGFLILPMAIGLFMIIYKYPDFARDMGMVTAKANLAGGAATWPFFLSMYAQGFAVGGLVLYSLIVSWVFGREFSDGTMKDLLAVPVSRGSIVLAKFIVVALWAIAQTALVYGVGLVVGAVIGMPDGSAALLASGTLTITLTALMVLVAITPVAFFASAGRGYLLPVGIAILILAMANIIALLGWGAYFPWSIPGMYAGISSENGLAPASLWILFATGIAGVAATYGWWKYADQNK